MAALIAAGSRRAPMSSGDFSINWRAEAVTGRRCHAEPRSFGQAAPSKTLGAAREAKEAGAMTRMGRSGAASRSHERDRSDVVAEMPAGSSRRRSRRDRYVGRLHWRVDIEFTTAARY